MSKKNLTQHQGLARTGTVKGVGSVPRPSNSARFREGGFVKHKQTEHLKHGAPLGFNQMPHSADSHERRSHLKCGGRAKKD